MNGLLVGWRATMLWRMRLARHRQLAFCLLTVAVSCGGSEPDEVHVTPVTYDGKNRVLYFDGVADYATTGTAAFPFPEDPQTITLWVRITPSARGSGDSGAAAGVATLIALRKDFDSGLKLGLRDGAFEAWNVAGMRTFARATTPATMDRWQHLAYTFDGSTHRLYVDGQLTGEGRAEPNNRTPTTAWLGSGDGSTELFAGYMDEVRLYTVAVKVPDIAAQAVRGRVRETALEQQDALVLWMGFDEVSGYRALDRSGRGNDALLGDGVPECMPQRAVEDP